MVRQGSPRLPIVFARTADRFARRLPLKATTARIAFCLWSVLCCATSAHADPTVNLRVAWGGGAERQWHGSITIDSGLLQVVRPLGNEADEPGSIWSESGRVEIRQRSVRAYDAVDLVVTAPLDAKLTLEFRDAQDPNLARTAGQVSLAEALGRPWKIDLDKAGNRLLVRRGPGDTLRVRLDRDHLVFSPGETLHVEVEPCLLPVAPGTSLQLRGRLVATIGGAESAVQEQSIQSTAEGAEPATVAWDFPIPEREGVYDLVIDAFEPPALRWGRAKLIAERRVQTVVIADHPPPIPADANVAWTRVMEIDPANPRWFERFKSWSLFPGLAQGPLGNGGLHIGRHPLGPIVQLGPGGEPPGIHWEAYPLTIAQIGAPHILEVEYPSDVPQTLGISVVEPNAAGVVRPIGLDSGVYMPAKQSQTPTWLRHRVLFWPHSKSPIALLTNRRNGSLAAYSKIRVFAGPARLPRAYPADDVPERLIAGYMSRPLLPENFGAAEAVEPATGRSLDDWQTFYDAVSRLAEYLNHVGYGGQMLGVMAAGSTIYPSDRVEPTPQHDSGPLFDSGQDPLRKDVLEMTLRIFDRERLKLIPTLQFAAPLPALEAKLRHGGPDAAGIQLIGAAGTPYVESHPPRHGMAPYYNPLDEHVQEEMVGAVREVVERYGQHPSLAGIGIELCADGFAQLPGEAWGLDDATIARFERETNIRVPGSGESRFGQRARFLAEPAQREVWLNWRAAVLSRFYERLQNELLAVRPEAKLFLVPTDLFDSPDARRALQPALPATTRPDDVLFTFGIHLGELQRLHGLVFLRSQRVQPPGSLAIQGADIELNRATDFDDRLRGGPYVASLHFHDPLKASLPSFEEQSPFGKNRTTAWLASHMLPSDARNRQRFVHSLAALDPDAMFDGGWMLPLGQEESLADFVAAYRRLPGGKFQTCSDSTQPVVIRWLTVNGQTYMYLVNDSPWVASVRLQMQLPSGCRAEDLSGRRRLPPIHADGWSLSLEPFDLIAVRFASPDVRIARAELLPNEQARAALEHRVRELQQRVAALVNPPQVSAVANPEFESPAAAGAIPGWSVVGPNVGDATLGPEGPQPPPGKRAGKAALRLASNGPVVSLRSDPFPPPTTGRLSISVWLRVDDPQIQPALRLAIEGMHQGKDYYSFGQVGAGVDPIPAQWKQYVLLIDDLPKSELDKLRIHFELTNAASVWIDDVQAYHLFFDGKERVQLSKIVALADYQLQSGKLSECLHELEGYWPQFLEAYVPLEQTPGQAVAADAPPAAAPPGAQGTPPATKSATRPLERLRGIWRW